MPRLVMETGRGVVVKYTNYKGITEVRRLIVRHIWYGESEWHEGAQWFVSAWDIVNQKFRDFAIKDMRPNDD